MSYTLVAERPRVFKAAASVIGTMSGHTWRHREKIRPVPIQQISGLDDEIIPYDGSMSPAGGWGGAPKRPVSERITGVGARFELVQFALHQRAGKQSAAERCRHLDCAEWSVSSPDRTCRS